MISAAAATVSSPARSRTARRKRAVRRPASSRTAASGVMVTLRRGVCPFRPSDLANRAFRELAHAFFEMGGGIDDSPCQLSPAPDMRSNEATPLCAIRRREQVQQCAWTRRQLLDYLVGARGKRRRHIEAERLRSLEIDDELELSRLHGGKLGRLGALENAPGIDAALSISIGQAGSVACQAADLDELTPLINRRHHIPRGQCNELFTPAVKEWIGGNQKGAGTQLRAR